MNVPNIADSPAVQSRLNYTIQYREPKLIRDILGNALYNAFMVGLGYLPDGTFLNVDNGQATTGVISIPDITTTGDVTLIAGTTQGFAVGTSYYIAPWLKGYGYSLELRGTGTLTEGIDYVDNVNGGFAFPNITLQNGQTVTIHLKSAPPIPTTSNIGINLWATLLNGCDYTGIDGLQHHFSGFIDLRDTYGIQGVKRSPIAGYCYYWYVRENMQLVAKSDSPDLPALAKNMAIAWNNIADFLDELQYFMYSFQTSYPLFSWISFYNAQRFYSRTNTFGI